MRVLVIDDAAKARMKALREYALANRESLAHLLRRIGDETQVPGNNPSHVLKLFDGYRVVMTVEQQPEPIRWCYHFSFSVSQPEAGPVAHPHPAAVDEILAELGVPGGCRNALSVEIVDHIVELWFQCED